MAYAFFYFSHYFIIFLKILFKEETSIKAIAMLPAIKSVCAPVFMAKSMSFFIRAIIVLYIPAPGTKGIIPGIKKSGTGFLNNLANTSDMMFTIQAPKNTANMWERDNLINIMQTNHPIIPLIPHNMSAFLGPLDKIAKNKLTKKADIN